MLVNNLLTEDNDIKETVKNVNTSTVYQRFQSVYRTISLYYLKCKEEQQKQQNKQKIKFWMLQMKKKS